MVELENRPRYDSIKWYLEIVGLDFKDTIDVVNNMPKLYTPEGKVVRKVA